MSFAKGYGKGQAGASRGGDPVPPSGYAVAFSSDEYYYPGSLTVQLNITGAEVGCTYNYSITSSGGGSAVTGNGTVSSESFSISNINVTGLIFGTMTVAFYLTDTSLNVGATVNDTAILHSQWLGDEVGTAAKVALLNKFRSAYGGSAILNRRSSDSNELAIGFAANGIDFDDAAWTTHVGGGTGYVRTWYDQSGNANHSQQATGADQPQVLLNQLNTKASLLTIVLKEMTFTNINFGRVYDIFMIFNGNNNAGFIFAGGGKGTAPESYVFGGTGASVYHSAGAGGVAIPYTLSKTTWYLANIRANGHESVSLILNNVLIGYFRTANAALQISNMLIDPASSNDIYLVGQIHYSRGLSANEVNVSLNNLANYTGLATGSPYISAYYHKTLAVAPFTGGIGTIRDGVGTVYFPPTDTWYALGGWVSGVGSCSEVYSSTNGGVTWNYLGLAPWSIRHWFTCLYKDSKIWVGGKDGASLSTDDDMWTWDPVADPDPATGFINLTTDVGNKRALAAWCLFDNKIIRAGGQLDLNGTYFTDMLEYNESTNLYDVTGTIPIAYFTVGTICEFGDYIYLGGGIKITLGVPSNYNDKIYRTPDKGQTWELMVTDARLKSSYPFFKVLNGRLFYLMGYNDTAPAENKEGVFSTVDGVTWVLEPYPTSRHATTMDTDGTKLIGCAGNERSDVFMIGIA